MPPGRGDRRARDPARSALPAAQARRFTSEHDLAKQMLAYVETYNQTAKPFRWTYTGKVLEA
jgi:hypothetical protein